MPASQTTPVSTDPAARLDAIDRLDGALARLQVELAAHLERRRAQTVRLEAWSGRHRQDFETDTGPLLAVLGGDALRELRLGLARQRLAIDGARPGG